MPPWHGVCALVIPTPFLFAKRKHWAHPAMLLQCGFPQRGWACCWPWPSGASQVSSCCSFQKQGSKTTEPPGSCSLLQQLEQVILAETRGQKMR